MARYRNTLWCDGCGIEIHWEPIERNDLKYCCLDCQDGIQCMCEEVEDESFQANQSPKTNYYLTA